MNKKGVSPIIATILLMAFAVSLGAVIINLGSALGDTYCESVDIEVFSVDGQDELCFNVEQQAAFFTLYNTGSKDVNAVKITFTSDSQSVSKEIREVIAPFDKNVKAIRVDGFSNLRTFSIIPIVQKSDGSLSYCSDKVRDYGFIAPCSD